MDMLLEQFKTIFDRPEKVKKLREYILQLAVRGKLVEQDVNDEPASVLLEKIKEEKERLVKEKKIKKEKELPEIGEDEVPYELPEGWEWVRLGSLGITQTGTTPSTKNNEYFNGKTPFIKPGDISHKGINFNNESLTELGLTKGRLINKNSVLMVCIGGSIGKNYFAERECSCNQQINSITGLGTIECKFLYYFLSSIEFYNQILLNATGSATPIINKSKWENLSIQLPPLNEQKRIVEKVDSLMDLCDKLEAYLEKKVKYGALSSKSIFNSIGNCKSSEELEEVLKFIITNFKELTLGDDAVKELKNGILQLAVQGKLVPQEKNDEPASVLLKKIKEEKDRLVKEKKIKKEKELPEIGEDEKNYFIPENWQYIRLGDLANIITDGTHQTPRYTEEGMMFLSAQNVKPFKFMPNKCRYVSIEDYEKYIKNVKPEEGDILLTRVGSNIGEATVIDQELDFAIYVSLCLIKFNKLYMDSKYVCLWLNSPDGTNKSISNILGRGTSQGNLNLTLIRNFIIPIPPLNEQKQIIEKVDSLMALCDELEKRIEQSKKNSELLMESVLQEAFNIN
ncbi:restriction endonuclease subunit S [Clostridium grantii]|uniref:Type I restriction enzyme, S subunit n=1 Tax=Clostridium grantii DSM 8605 TaxID=1121316 RepID=A0A1M5RD74_9CLOT|nr:restriction endonuclease subunit S [Clostridium grantii]SHH24221.1 type I restriction enzyme, S subunit [Clostridium grantii DSM 8605]